ncbi:MAG: nicotinate-nucleotide diphosphorylase (carboxylating), partial [candidate division Zixibacteria bacterium]|nr:nicotinate-nucleotide diphosphorylase (carboxylating) [candidate division Zixibacteria bacterium]
IEVTNLREFETALEFDIDRIMLDNFIPATVSKAVDLAKKAGKYGKVEIEVSGGVNLKNIERFAVSGVDFISVGAVTHSAPAFDLSLIIE